MSEFPELHESHPEPSFLRPVDSTPPGRKYRPSRQHQASRRSWLPPTPEVPRKPPPPRPVPIPSPHIKARGLTELNQNVNPQYEDVDQDDPDLESRAVPREGLPTPYEEEEGTLLGSLISGLRGLSKAMRRDRAPQSQPAPPGVVLSGYESPGRPGSFYVQASRTPVTTPPPAAIRQHHSPSRTSEHSHDHGSIDLHDGDTTVVHHETAPLSPSLSDPPSAELRASSDYAKMDSPDASSDISLHSSVKKFFRDLNDLPWVATHVAADYLPGQSTPRRRPIKRRPVSSWYSHDHRQSVDLLSSGSSATPPPRHRLTSSVISPMPSLSPGVAYREGYPTRSPKISSEAPVYISENHGFPKYPHGYAPAPQPRYVAQPAGSVRGHREAQPVHLQAAPGLLPRDEAHESQYPYLISRPPIAQTP